MFIVHFLGGRTLPKGRQKYWAVRHQVLRKCYVKELIAQKRYEKI